MNILVALEGLDNAGKTTLIQDLAQDFAGTTRSVLCTKELTSTIGPRILEGLKKGQFNTIDKILLFAADRQLRCSTDLRVSEGRLTLCFADRWIYSALAYRCAEDPNVEEYVLDVNSIFPKPTITVLIDISPAESLRRGAPLNKNNYSEVFLAQVRAQYLRLSSTHDLAIIDGMREYDAVRSEVKSLIAKELGNVGGQGL